MVNISSTNIIYKPIGKFMNRTATGVLKNALEKARKEPVKYAARLLVYSFISKDFINTCVYTYQSLNNKKIPEEKRSFVAANDFVLGFFNFAGQILMQTLCEKFITPKFESRYTGTEKFKDGTSLYKNSKAPMAPDNIDKLVKNVIKEKQAEFKNLRPENIKEISEYVIKKAGASSQRGKDITAGLAIVISSLATTALVKRTISPLFATPIAGWLGDKWDKKTAAKATPKLDIVESDVLYNKYKTNTDTKKN